MFIKEKHRNTLSMLLLSFENQESEKIIEKFKIFDKFNKNL